MVVRWMVSLMMGDGGDGSSGLGIEYQGTINYRSGVIRAGFGGGGGGGWWWKTW